MMSMHFPYGNSNTTGQHSYGTGVCPSFGINYNQYFSSLYSNSNGLLPTPLMGSSRPLNNREYKALVPKNLVLPSLPMSYEPRRDEFLTFIQQKSKPMSELNPFANEFSLVQNQLVPVKHEKTSSYKLIFDDLIEQSLQSIEAIKKASKIISVNHVSTQCHQSIDQINRSTQTTDDNDQYDLLKEYSSSAVKLTRSLLEDFQSLLQLPSKNDCRYQLNSISQICDELHYSISILNQLITSKKSSMNRDNLFSNMIKDRSIQSSPMIFGIEERARRVISSSSRNHSSSSSSSRQIDPITMKRSELCLLCRKPLDHNDDAMHPLCRLLSSPPDRFVNL